MIKVQDYGNKIAVKNPRNGSVTEMINVIFIEEGRSGVNAHMSETSAFLSSIVGEDVGLALQRTHTHPVQASKIGLFPKGQEFPGFVNRGLFSTPQMRAQLDADPRIIDGRPTYFATWIGNSPEEDVDLRMSNDELAKAFPKILQRAVVNTANVQVLQQAPVAANPVAITG